jgi:iron complex outermembrane receptor protein
MKYLTISLLLFFWLTSLAQVSGKFVEAGGQPVSFVTVILLDSTGNVLTRSALTDDKGAFRFEPVGQGRYVVKVSDMTHETWSSPVFGLAGIKFIKRPRRY